MFSSKKKSGLLKTPFSLRNFGLLSFFLASTAWGNLANHTLWLEHGGGVKGTGSNEYGQLSMDVLRQSENPISSKFGVREVAVGEHTVYLMWDGTVWATGSNSYGQLGDGTTAKSIKSSTSHECGWHRVEWSGGNICGS